MLQALLFLTHTLCDSVLSRFHAMEVPSNISKFILLDGDAYDGAVPLDAAIHVFKFADVCKGRYTPIHRDRLVPGSNHFPVIEFALSHPQFKQVWAVEFDVYFTGSWCDLLLSVGDSVDFIATKIRKFANDPHWQRWGGWQSHLHEVPRQNLLASFNPIYRLSRRAANYLDAAYASGCRGHHEVTMATLLFHAGMCVEELGGNGEFTPSNRKGRYYTIGRTFRWRPLIDPRDMQLMPDTLYHPLK